MDSLLARLERRFGKLAIENLPAILIGGMVLVYLMGMLKPGFANALVLDPYLVLHGQPWRLITFIFIPPSTSLIFIVFVMMFAWTILTSLEAEWGAFKLNVFYAIGTLGTAAAAFITRQPIGNGYLDASCLLAFGTLFPNYEIRLFLILPVRMKWIALLTGGLYLFQCIGGSWTTRAEIIAALANYLLFFTEHLVYLWRSRNLQTRQAARRVSMRPEPQAQRERAVRVCAICGKREDEEGADMRVCPCDVCRATGGPRVLCLEHARNH